jgi:hypothetical protein
MRQKRINHFNLSGVLLFCFILFLLTGCEDNGIPLNDLRGQIQGGAKRSVELVFDAADPIVALIDNKKGSLYAATSAGEIYRITGVNKAEKIYRGLSGSPTSWTAFTLTKDGILVANTNRDNKDVIMSITDKGEVKELAVIEARLLSLAKDSRGKIYIAAWTSEGNVSISLNPRSLAGAEFIIGKIYELQPDGFVNQIFEGGIPVWIGVNDRDTLVASVWGRKGYFAPEKKTYRYADPYRAYWLALSDKIQFLEVPDGKKRFENSMIDSLSLFVMPEDDYLLGYGIAKDGTAGIFLIEENRPPIKLLLKDEKYEKNITSLALFNNVVYFGNTDGSIYRIK